MNETKKKITEYTKMMAGIKEKVVATLILFVVSAVMMTTVSFAWMTMSRNPEVTGVSTSLAANGNLEIALAPSDGSVPPESKVGDSLKSIFKKNTTWGNLVNLSIPDYGLDSLVLRPARLNTAALLTSPIYAAKYGNDGRVETLTTSFAFAKWNMENSNFIKSDERGVRAVVSTTLKDYEGDKVFYEMTTKMKDSNIVAAGTYSNLDTNSDYMNTLATLMGLYMTARMNSSHATLSNPDCEIEDIRYLVSMYTDLLNVYDLEMDAIATIIQTQQYIITGGTSTGLYDREWVYNLFEKDEKGNYPKLNSYLSSLNKYLADNQKEPFDFNALIKIIEDRNTIASDLEKLKALSAQGGDLKWKDSGLNDIVNNLVNVGACTVDGTPINSIGASNAMQYISGTHEAKITNGILYRLEEFCGEHIEVKGLKITATINRMGITMPGTVTANISTSVDRGDYVFTKYMNSTKNMKTGIVGTGVEAALDTYALAIDFFLRTNAEHSFLTLEGNILTETRQERATGRTPDGDIVELYTFEVGDEEFKESIDIYKIEEKVTNPDTNQEETVETWYYYEGHGELEEEILTEYKDQFREKIVDVEYVIGYEGENRIWSDAASNVNLTVNSTTQGSGSCYVYYADTPEDQARSLNVLAAVQVVFIDENGGILATAYLDTERHYADSGKVIVPLVLNNDGVVIGTDQEGNTIYGITALEKNKPTLITTLIYIDGEMLENDDVLAAADIQGQLNIQFASSSPLYPLGNDDLKSKEINVTASVSKTSFDYDNPDDHPMTTTLSVNVDGVEPSRVEACFIRQINSTQGVREDMFLLSGDGSTNWTYDYTFTAPGKYVLKSVYIDGVEYNLSNDANNSIVINIEGFDISSLRWEKSENDSIFVLTADSTYTENLLLSFSASDASLMPSTVKGVFLRDSDGLVVNTEFKRNTSGVWVGEVKFASSGDYTLQYLLLNGEYTSVPSGLEKYATLNLGLKVRVYSKTQSTFEYDPAENSELEMLVKIITDNNVEMTGLSDVNLSYGMAGATKSSMDADLEWNQSEGYYTGNMIVPGAGIYTFYSVSIGDDIIRKAETSVTFTILSPEPPSYEYEDTTDLQFAPNKNAIFKIALKNAPAAVIRPVIKNLITGEEYSLDYYSELSAANSNASFGEGLLNKFVTDENGDFLGFYNHYSTNEDTDGYTVFYFDVPLVNGSQDGKWQLIGIDIAQVYDDSEPPEFHSMSKPWSIDLSSENITTTVFSAFDVSFPTDGYNNDVNFGFTVDAQGNETVTGLFMDSYSLTSDNNNIALKFENDLVGDSSKIAQYITSVKVTYTHDKSTMQSYGHYTTASDLDPNLTTITATLTDSDKDAVFTLENNSYTFTYAGLYSVSKIEYTMSNGSSVTINSLANAPEISVKSKAPSATITAISPTGLNPTRITYTIKDIPWYQGGGKTPTFETGYPEDSKLDQEKNTATLYAVASADNSTQRHGTFTRPTITITIAGISNEYDATIILPAGSAASNIKFSRTGNGTITEKLGSVEQINSWTSNVLLTHTLDAYYGHGEQTISTMTVSKNNVAYTIYLEKQIVIINPSSTNQ